MAARYLLTAAAFLNGSLRRAGEIVEFDGKPSKAMQIIKDTAPAQTKPKKGGGEPSKAASGDTSAPGTNEALPEAAAQTQAGG